ncbi:MAG: SDR family oxidoreductase [Candidatus Zixiibacteriota bacterium]|nr:MAG: SDR family oxidoreductase [candidate division Zixibacteria bacterium]
MKSLKDRSVVVTGASRGIGAAIARAFAGEGCRLTLCGRNMRLLEAVAASCELPETSISTVTADVREPSGMKKIVDTAYEKFGKVDIFINNAGVGYRRSIIEIPEAEYDATFDTNLKAVFLSFKELIPRMKKQGGGQIINVSSRAAKKSDPGIAVYAASKAALDKMSESVANEVRGDNIRICVVAPGYTATELVSKPAASKLDRSLLSTADVAGAVVYIARQNDNAWISMVDLQPLISRK